MPSETRIDEVLTKTLNIVRLATCAVAALTVIVQPQLLGI